MKTFYGLADCYGIESFIDGDAYTQQSMLRALNGEKRHDNELSSQISMLVWRAKANYQRHPAVYMAKLSDGDAKVIQRMINGHKYEKALIYLKEHAIEIGIAKGDPFFKKHWEDIPNPKLDPFHD